MVGVGVYGLPRCVPRCGVPCPVAVGVLRRLPRARGLLSLRTRRLREEGVALHRMVRPHVVEAVARLERREDLRCMSDESISVPLLVLSRPLADRGLSVPSLDCVVCMRSGPTRCLFVRTCSHRVR